jgi:hypothetical protein
MCASKFLVAITLCLTATVAQASGFRSIDIPADAEGPVIQGAMWYPCAEPPGEVSLCNITLPRAQDRVRHLHRGGPAIPAPDGHRLPVRGQADYPAQLPSKPWTGRIIGPTCP